MRVSIEGIDPECRPQWRRYVAETIARAIRSQPLRCESVHAVLLDRGPRICCVLDVVLTDSCRLAVGSGGQTRAEAIEMAANRLSIALLPPSRTSLRGAA